MRVERRVPRIGVAGAISYNAAAQPSTMLTVRIVVGGRDLLDVARNIIGRYMPGFRYAEAAVMDRWASVAVAMVGEEAVGAEVFYGLPARPYSMCVHYYVATAEGWRRRGIASALVAHVEGICGAQLYLATTRLDNEPAMRLFTSLGYDAVSWDELPRGLADVLLRATCGYDDDVLLAKPSKLLDALLDADHAEIARFHRRECYAVWRATRGLA